MKKTKIILLTLLGVLSFNHDVNAQMYDYTDDLYLAIGAIDNGSYCGYNAPNYQPGNVFEYGTHTWIDLNKLYNTPYRENTIFNGDLTFWTTFGGFGHPTNPGEGWSGGQIDDNKKTFVATGTFGNGFLKFANVKIPGTTSSWGTAIWINVFSQCHDQCFQGTWWKFEQNLTADQARQFAASHTSPNATDEYVNGTRVVLGFEGNPSCDPTAVYGFGPGELN